MTRSEPKKEILRARFRVYHQNQSYLRTMLANKIVDRLGSDFYLTDISDKPFEPSGIELTLTVVGPPSLEIDLLKLEDIVRELGSLVKSFFQFYMPEAQAGADAYDVESEFWTPRGWLKKVELPEATSHIQDRRFELSQITTMNDREVEELLRALARKHLRPQILASLGPEFRKNVEQLLSTYRFLRVVYDRPEDVELYRVLGKEIETAPARPIVESLHGLGILDALDDAPRLLFANLRRSTIPIDDLDMLLRGGIEDPEAEITLLLYSARDFAPTGKKPSETMEEAAEVLRRTGEQMKTDQDNTPPLKKRKLLNGIGNLIMGLTMAGGNALLFTGTIAAPNPATAFLSIGSAATAIGAVFKGIGDLQGE